MVWCCFVLYFLFNSAWCFRFIFNADFHLCLCMHVFMYVYISLCLYPMTVYHLVHIWWFLLGDNIARASSWGIFVRNDRYPHCWYKTPYQVCMTWWTQKKWVRPSLTPWLSPLFQDTLWWHQYILELESLDPWGYMTITLLGISKFLSSMFISVIIFLIELSNVIFPTSFPNLRIVRYFLFGGCEEVHYCFHNIIGSKTLIKTKLFP